MKHNHFKFFVVLTLLQSAFFAHAQSSKKFNIDLAKLVQKEPNLEFSHSLNAHWDFRFMTGFRFFSKVETGQSETDFVQNQRNSEPITYKTSRPLINFGPFKPLKALDLSVGMRYTLNPKSKFKFFVQPMFDWYYLQGNSISDSFEVIDETVSTCCNGTDNVTLTQRYIHQIRLIENGANRTLYGVSAQTGVNFEREYIAIEARLRTGFNVGEADDFYDYQGYSRKYLKGSFVIVF
jgi:hypothetical protein